MTSRTRTGYQLPAAEGRADYIRENFDAIADTYDRFNDIITFGMHRLWKRKAIRMTGLPRYRASQKDANSTKPAIHAMDLCSGSGDLSLLFAQYLGPAARVTSLDYSPGMLAVQERRLSARPDDAPAIAPIEILQGDATDLSRFPDDSVDAITIGFGLRNVQDRAACLNECRRVLKPGARLVILDVGEVKGRIPSFFHNFYFDKIVPRIGHMLQGEHTEMFEYLPASAKIYPGPQELAAELLAAGFQSAPFHKLMLGAAVIHAAVK
ncbi:MAG: ubiquinone/menaquinone biosynthesis methyltransferase [bacterium]|nr:ubiquinone/menaquinone biosynthesis methyltransferase [bacterium]